MKHILFAIALIFVGNVSAQTLKNFHLKNLQNETRSYQDLKGETLTLLDFWATWCKPCTKAIPELNKIYDLYTNKGVQIIGINCDGPRSASKVVPISNALRIKYPVLIDINSEVMNELKLQTFPTLVIINAAGNIVWIHEGYSNGDAEIIKAEINKLLQK